MKNKKLMFLVLTAVLAALVVVLQIVGGIPVGPFTITLTLFPIVVGAAVLGPVSGLILGLVFGVVVSILSLTGKDPGGQMVFLANPYLAWALCLLKGAAAGVVPAFAYRLFSKHEKSATVVTYGFTGAFIFLGGAAVAWKLAGKTFGVQLLWTVILMLVAAGILIGMHFLFKNEKTAAYIASILAPVCNTGIFVAGMLIFFPGLLKQWSGGTNVAIYTITGLVGVNFLIEFFVAVVLTPALVAITNFAKKRGY
ncbi:MAG: ECF transporter S component [Clostridia bacterium]|nr:ECF transporter S component [Clostridia bacterium]